MVKHLVIWLLLVVLTPLVIPVVLTPKTLSTFIRNDYKSALLILGGKDNLDQSLVGLYRRNLSFVAECVNSFRDRHDDSNEFRHSGDPIGEAIADIPGNWASAVKLEAYSMALRTVILTKLSFWLLIPVIMTVAAGLLKRKLKYETFSAPLPPVYNTSAHILIAVFFMTVLWLVCPLPVLPVAFIPSASMVVCLFIYLAVAHYPYG